MRIGPPRTSRERNAVIRYLRGQAPYPRGAEPGVVLQGPAIEADALIAAWLGETPQAVAHYRADRNSTAYVWPPESCVGGETIDLFGAAILNAISSRIDALGCPVALCLTEPGRDDQRRALRRAAYREIGEIRTLRRSLRNQRVASESGELQWLPYCKQTAHRFATVIDRVTAADSIGCIELHRLTGHETLDSFRGNGGSSFGDCRLAMRHGQDLAVVLTNTFPDKSTQEITYLGVIPECRRQGIGSALIQSVLDAASDAGRENVVAVANSADVAAMSLYTRHGFVATDRQAGFVRECGSFFDAGDPAEGSDLH